MFLSTIFNKSNYIAFCKTLKETNLSTLFYRSTTTIKDAIMYPKWFKNNCISEQELEKQRATDFSYKPVISIVIPTYCTPIPFLHELMDSMNAQTYTNWELCVADASPDDSEIRSILTNYANKDSRIKVTFLEKNEGISGNTNHALQLSTGEFIGLLDHDDLLAPNALFEIVQVINDNPSIDVLYTDEDKIDSESGAHYYPNFKPDFNKLLLQSCNYICHFFVFKRSIYEQIGEFDSAYDGSQDYNYILRATRVANHVHHIPKMLYYWRVHRGSVAGNPGQKEYCYDAARRSLQENLDISNTPGTVEYSRLIGFYNTRYQSLNNTSVLVIRLDEQTEIEKHPIYETKIKNAKSLEDITHILSKATEQYCIILNQGIISLTSTQLEQTLSYFQSNEIGAITFKLTKKTKTSSLGLTYQNGSLAECYASVPKEDAGYYGRALLDQYIPLCSPSAFAFPCADMVSFLKEYTTNDSKTDTYTFDEFAIGFSLYLYTINKKVVGTAQVELQCNKKSTIHLSKGFIEKNKEQLQQASTLYCVPPYYK